MFVDCAIEIVTVALLLVPAGKVPGQVSDSVGVTAGSMLVIAQVPFGAPFVFGSSCR
ncbi:MAG: hypothetical protein JOZ54_23410 [Acidobacteria bacterium]|nr:hypothetical protein [Acidobacteriota bacterium]